MKKMFRGTGCSIVKFWAGLFFAACTVAGCDKGGDDPVPPDPSGTQTIQIPANESTTINQAIYITYAGDLTGGAKMTQFIKVGKIAGLGEIVSIPTSGWEYAVAAEPECGYIARCEGVYYRFYVVKHLYEGERMSGAEIKYQYPFEPTTLTLSQESLSFSVKPGDTGEKVEVTTDAAHWTYTCLEPWIKVSANGQQLSVFVEENRSIVGRHGEVLVSANERTKRIVVTQDSIRQTSAPYSVGDIYFEKGVRGVVYKVSDAGWQGMIVSLDEGRCQWGQSVEDAAEVDCVDLSNGMNNMETVQKKTQWEERYPAFKWCNDLNTGGITGWYLPAMNELKELYAAYNGMPEYAVEDDAKTLHGEAREKFNETLTQNGGVILTDTMRYAGAATYDYPLYWSSTKMDLREDNETLFPAHLDFIQGQTGTWKETLPRVRAVRPF
ncbi:MAG: hypothetical protein LBP98_07620 [Tannerella sp.]|jgi:hypothetical protein|nr:hypothetical protein [Tannerella sp.]